MKGLALISILSLVFLACSQPPPRRTLRTGMLDLDGNFRELRGIIGVPQEQARARELVQRMVAWGSDSLFENHPESGKFKGSQENFRSYHRLYTRTVAELAVAVEANEQRARQLYVEVSMSCEACHREFRPGL